MYNQNFRNQAVKEVKNGSTVTSVAKKFDISKTALNSWIDDYDKKMCEIIRDDNPQPEPVIKPKSGIRLKSIKVVISGAIVTLGRNDVLKLLKLFDEFEQE
tara:strand:- start:38 stop:340 length:303 start_codon:yes stop_codon:yes gene_type:complete